MPHRSHKRLVPTVKAGTVTERPQFWNPHPERRNAHLPEATAPYGVGRRRATDLDIPGKPLAKEGNPFDG